MIPRRLAPSCLCLGVLLAGIPASLWAQAAQLPIGFSDELVVSGLDLPTNLAFLPDGRLFVVERVTGRVRLVVRGAIAAVDPVVTITELRTTNAEQGLLGVAIDPGWPARPYLYVQFNYSGAPEIRIRRYTVTGDLDGTGDGSLTIDPASSHEVLEIPDFNGPHNGGTLRFGPDGLLYSSLGDDLFHCDAQEVANFFGKILRLDVSALPAGPGGPPSYAQITPAGNPFVAHADPRAHLVWQYGLRNPWSFHIDPTNGDLFIADVGAAEWEEVDFAAAPGLNFGWAWYEGPDTFSVDCNVPGSNFVAPIYAYDRTFFPNGASVISGGVYRRPPGGTSAFPAQYEGSYFFSDLGEGFLRRLERTGDTWSLAAPVPGQPSSSDWGRGFEWVTNFMQAADGSLWYLKYAGQVRKIVHDGVTGIPWTGRADDVRLGVYPSPTRSSVHVIYTLPSSGRVEVGVYDLAGRCVQTLVQPWEATAGRHEAIWDGRDRAGGQVPAGIYLVRLSLAGRHVHRRVPIVP